MRKFIFLVSLVLVSAFTYSLEYLGEDSPGNNSPKFRLFKSNANMDAYRLFTDEIREGLKGPLVITEVTCHVEMPDLGVELRNMLKKHSADLAVTIFFDMNGPTLALYRYSEGKYYLYKAKFYMLE